MRKIIVLVSAIIALIISSLSAVGWSAALAQNAPPDLGDVILEDPLAAPGLPNMYTCPTGRVTRQFANDGLTITASGGCQMPEGFAGSGVDGFGSLRFVDGEFRVEFASSAVWTARKSASTSGRIINQALAGTQPRSI